MKKKVGFESGTHTINESGDIKILENMQEVEKLLSSEVTTADKFKSILSRELKEIDEFIKEIEKYKAQLVQIEKLANHKRKLGQQIKDLFYVEPTQRDVEKIIELFSMYNALTPELEQMIHLFAISIERFHLNQLGNLYSESDKNKKIIREMDGFSRKMHTDASDISLEMNTLDKQLAEIYTFAVEQLEERKQKNISKKKYGFL